MGASKADPRLITVGLPLLVVTTALAAAEGLKAAGALPVFLPAPSMIWLEARTHPALLLGALWPTLTKALIGYAIAAVIAVSAAAIATLIGRLYSPIYNLGVGIQSVPLIATTPLIATALGTGAETQIIVAILSCQFPMLVGAMQGFRAADERHRELFHILSARKSQAFRLLILPAALPHLFGGFKIAAPAAVLGTITGEWAGAEHGVGAMMLYALFSYDTSKVWLSVLAVAGLAGGGYALGALAERIVVFWENASDLER
jgi:ABC-type nitrate/sulfonate/bicarbonate transport system permease component